MKYHVLVVPKIVIFSLSAEHFGGGGGGGEYNPLGKYNSLGSPPKRDISSPGQSI